MAGYYGVIRQSGPPADGDYHGLESGQYVLDTLNCVIYQNVGTAEATVWARIDGEEEDMAGQPRWIGPWTIYGLQQQTLSFSADGGESTYLFNGEETAPIAFDAVAADYTAAFEALPGVGAGKMPFTGTPGAVSCIIDLSIIPTLITTGTNDLVLDPDPAAVDIFITDVFRTVELMTIQEGDIVVDYMLNRVETFSENATFSLGDGPAETEEWYSPRGGLVADMVLAYSPSGNVFTKFGGAQQGGIGLGSSPRQANPHDGVDNVDLPTPCLQTSPLYALIYDLGGSGSTTGIAKLWLCIATPVPPPG